MSELTKEQKELLNKEAQEEAKRRAEKIDAFGNQMLKDAIAADLTVNDLQVVLTTLIQQFEAVFRSHSVSAYVDKEVSEPAAEPKAEYPVSEETK